MLVQVYFRFVVLLVGSAWLSLPSNAHPLVTLPPGLLEVLQTLPPHDPPTVDRSTSPLLVEPTPQYFSAVAHPTPTMIPDSLHSDERKMATLPPLPAEQRPEKPLASSRFAWGKAVKESFFFNGILQVGRLATEPETRAELKGPFFKDYLRTLKSLRGWDDGDNFVTNYIGHPMQGAVSGRIQIHNDPMGIKQDFGWRKDYLKSRLKALSWAALFSTQFELGILGEAGIGNVGMKPREKSRHPMAFEDLVVTPTVGTAWLVGEDALDRFLVRPLERKFSPRVLRLAVRIFFNPTRSMANITRFKYPWHRDDRPL